MDAALTRRCDACGYRFEAAQTVCSVDGKRLPPPDPRVAELGSFRLAERLGDGGMGAVYRAIHDRLGRVVAIKLLHKDLTSDRGLVGRFFAEARAANTIRHEHVVDVYDFVESGDDVYFVMEYLKGEDLHDAIHRSTSVPASGGSLMRPRGGAGMDPARAVPILEQIAAALHATHARNIVHRDLKPENVFLSEKDGRRDFVKIFDFGVAKLDRPDGRSTVQGAVLGTPEYMAPEQASGGAVDGRADLYSLGCIAYEMLTRRQIFGGGTQPEILVRQMTVTPPPVRTHAPEVPASLDAAIMRALEKDPGRRPQSALAFAESLARALGRELDSPAAFREPLRATPAGGARTLTSPTLTLRRPRSARWRWLALGAAVLTLLMGAVVAAKRRAAVTLAASPVVVRTTALVTVQLQSVPSGAEILDDRAARLGVTPYELVVPAGETRQVRFQKAGFRPALRSFDAAADTTVAVRLDPEARALPRRERIATRGPGAGGAVGRRGAQHVGDDRSFRQMIEQPPDAAPAAPAADLPAGDRVPPRVGQRIGPYLLVGLIGEGTGGRVFEVVHEQLGRRAALKLLDGARATRPSARARFFAEALSINRINHPHIVEVTDIVETDEHAGLVMELLEGLSLGAAMREGPLPPERFLPILAQTCEALAAAHAAGFVHRDLKPENVFLSERHGSSDFVKLLDFGVAAPLAARTPAGASSSSGVWRGTFVGTPAYASPEQASGNPVDHTTDLYAVGVMLYELACGRLPFEGWSAGELLIQHMSAPAPRLPAEVCATPLGRALDAIVQGCMAKEPLDRFSSAAELAAKLAALARGETVSIVTAATSLGRPRRLWHVALGVAAALGALVLASVVVERGLTRSSTPAPASAVDRRPGSTPQPARAPFVKVTFESEPAGAEARLVSDGSLLGVTPFRRAFPRRDAVVIVEIARAGYEPVRLEVSTSATRTVSVLLSSARPARAARPRRPERIGSEKTIDPFPR
jgi:serine/threonine protein kinase